MKKIYILITLLMVTFCFAFPTIAEDATAGEPTPLTIDNCEDLAWILNAKDPFDPKVEDFATSYKGQTIEFDGNIAFINNHGSYQTRYDILILAGDYSETTFAGPNFQFSDVGVIDLGLSGLSLPSFVVIGTNIRITAKVKEYNENSGLFMLEPILIEERDSIK